MAMPAGQLRASDAERDRVIELLRRHAADGRLTMDEFEERVGEVLAATTRDDLRPPLRDLPALAPAERSAPPPARRTWRPPTLDRRAAGAVAVAVVTVAVIATGAWWMWWLVFPLMGVLGKGGAGGGWCGAHRADGHGRHHERSTRSGRTDRDDRVDDRDVITV